MARVRLSELKSVLKRVRVRQFEDIEITSLTSDSRSVAPSALFVALRGGGLADRHAFIGDAIQRGAVAVLVEDEQPALSVPQLIVPDVRVASAILANHFYGYPSQHLRVIGVTGTNGKTTTTHLIEWILRQSGAVTGLLGTVAKRIAGQVSESSNTTSESTVLQASLREMVDAGCQYAVMEVSSHALLLKRDAGTCYRTAVFTNLTQDHMELHGTMENYRAAKAKLFARLGNSYHLEEKDRSYGVINADDAASSTFADEAVVECLTYGIDNLADVRGTDLRYTPNGTEFHLSTWQGEAEVRLPLLGRFNVYNTLAAVCVSLLEGIDLNTIVEALSTAPSVPGRFEQVSAGQPFMVAVDYSHTPDSLQNAIALAREMTQGRVITVAGCGGDRDRTKRPIMAQIAANMSDIAIYTSDNPRSEDPLAILDDMEAGVRGIETVGRYERIVDRALAINRAILLANPGDVVLIAGKGHETYQIIGSVTSHFDDREVAAKAIRIRYAGGEQ